MTTNTILGWHFVGDKLRSGAPVPPDGEILRHDGRLQLCESGLHASKDIIDALNYAPGETICRVLCGGEIVYDTDKFVCRERTTLWRISGNKVLYKFARRQALSVAHLWDIPPVVREYLETGDEFKRADAWAACAAANATYEVACAAANAVASAAWAYSATSADNAAYAACACANAARAAARAAAWDAGDVDTARDTARDAANQMLTQMIEKLHFEASLATSAA